MTVSLDYALIIDKLFSLTNKKGIKPGLERVQRMNEMLGRPASAFRSIHVAGTNGKGSVCWKVSQALQEKGFSVGLFTSPHIGTYRERFRLNGEMISEEEAAELIEEVMHLDPAATFFEITTLVAFLYFARSSVDVAVVEVGMGGRLDATNIIDAELTAITSIGYDHQEFLGETLEKIAFEKAGIVKGNTPVVIGPSVPRSCLKNKHNVHMAKGPFNSPEEENSMIAGMLCQLWGVEPSKAALASRPPCRMEKRELLGVTYFFDVAHNIDGIKAMIRSIKKAYPKSAYHFVCGLSQGKDLKGIIENIDLFASSIHFVQASNERAVSTETLRFTSQFFQVNSYRTVAEGMKAAHSEAIKSGGVVCVCGSFFIMADALASVGIEYPRDDFDSNERYLAPTPN